MPHLWLSNGEVERLLPEQLLDILSQPGQVSPENHLKICSGSSAVFRFFPPYLRVSKVNNWEKGTSSSLTQHLLTKPYFTKGDPGSIRLAPVSRKAFFQTLEAIDRALYAKPQSWVPEGTGSLGCQPESQVSKPVLKVLSGGRGGVGFRRMGY